MERRLWVLVMFVVANACLSDTSPQIVSTEDFLCVPFHFGNKTNALETVELVRVSAGAECHVSELRAANVSGKAVLVFGPNSGCSPGSKALSIQRAGGVAMIFVSLNAVPGWETFRYLETGTDEIRIWALAVSSSQGDSLKTKLKEGPVWIQISPSVNPWISGFFGPVYSVHAVIIGLYAIYNTYLTGSKMFYVIRTMGLQLSISQVCLSFLLPASVLRIMTVIPPICYCIPAMALAFIDFGPTLFMAPAFFILAFYFDEISDHVFVVASFLRKPQSKALMVFVTTASWAVVLVYCAQFQYFIMPPDVASVLGFSVLTTWAFLGLIFAVYYLYNSYKIFQLRFANVPRNQDSVTNRGEKRKRAVMSTMTGCSLFCWLLLIAIIIGTAREMNPKTLFALQFLRLLTECMCITSQAMLFGEKKKDTKGPKAKNALTRVVSYVTRFGAPQASPKASDGAEPQVSTELSIVTSSPPSPSEQLKTPVSQLGSQGSMDPERESVKILEIRESMSPPEVQLLDEGEKKQRELSQESIGEMYVD